VSVGVKLRGRPGILSIGREFRPVEWLTFVIGFKAKGPERKGLVRGIAFSEKLPCTEKLIGHVRYRVGTDSGRLLRERIAPFRLHLPVAALRRARRRARRHHRVWRRSWL
jgi:hypothetical protein